MSINGFCSQIGKYFSELDIIENKQPNPINKTEFCSLINTKKEKYYTHTYDPKKIKKILDEYPNLFVDTNEVFDFTPKNNCCNCISLTLYYTNTDDLTPLLLYLNTIKRTIKNVSKNLKDWIVRIYLDKSVYDTVIAYGKKEIIDDSVKDICNLLDFYYNSENVELYTYFCENITKKHYPEQDHFDFCQ
jgi:hypothetical protein